MSLSVAELRSRPESSLARTTLAVGMIAAGLTAGAAAVARAAGSSLDAHGQVPIAAFAQFTFVGALMGGVMVAFFDRRSTAPRRRFLQTAAVLTGITLVAPLSLAPDAGSMLSLVATHLVAAAIIVPVLARRLTDRRSR
jgi:peptidoglycan/LPS O-acetylase OafA/YrhL